MGRKKKVVTAPPTTLMDFSTTPKWFVPRKNNKVTVNTFIDDLIKENTALKKIVANVVTTNV